MPERVTSEARARDDLRISSLSQMLLIGLRISATVPLVRRPGARRSTRRSEIALGERPSERLRRLDFREAIDATTNMPALLHAEFRRCRT